MKKKYSRPIRSFFWLVNQSIFIYFFFFDIEIKSVSSAIKKRMNDDHWSILFIFIFFPSIHSFWLEMKIEKKIAQKKGIIFFIIDSCDRIFLFSLVCFFYIPKTIHTHTHTEGWKRKKITEFFFLLPPPFLINISICYNRWIIKKTDHHHHNNFRFFSTNKYKYYVCNTHTNK